MEGYGVRKRSENVASLRRLNTASWLCAVRTAAVSSSSYRESIDRLAVCVIYRNSFNQGPLAYCWWRSGKTEQLQPSNVRRQRPRYRHHPWQQAMKRDDGQQRGTRILFANARKRKSVRSSSPRSIFLAKVLSPTTPLQINLLISCCYLAFECSFYFFALLTFLFDDSIILSLVYHPFAQLLCWFVAISRILLRSLKSS